MNSEICFLNGAELTCEDLSVAYLEAECGRDTGKKIFMGARRPGRRSQLAEPVLNEPGLQTWLSKAEETALFVKRLYRTSC